MFRDVMTDKYTEIQNVETVRLMKSVPSFQWSIYVALVPGVTPGTVYRALSIAKDKEHDRRFFKSLAVRRARKLRHERAYRQKLETRMLKFKMRNELPKGLDLRVGRMDLDTLPAPEKGLIKKRKGHIWPKVARKVGTKVMTKVAKSK